MMKEMNGSPVSTTEPVSIRDYVAPAATLRHRPPPPPSRPSDVSAGDATTNNSNSSHHDHHTHNNGVSPSPSPLPSPATTPPVTAANDSCHVTQTGHDKDKDKDKDKELRDKEKELRDKEQDQLLHWKDMPRHLQFNPYIFTGYRPLLSFWGCINSLFYFHNETINIMTHAIPIIYILATVPALLPWSDSATHWFLCWCHMLGLVSPWVGSFLYHLFMNLERSEKVYYRLLQVDMLGIWINQSFGALPMVIATTYCLPLLVRWVFASSYCLLSLWGFYKAMTAWSPWERRLCFLLPFTVRMVLCVIRYTSYGGGDPSAFIHIILQDLVSVIGAAIGAMHIPEKWFPGFVDLYLNSHNIMHVLVVAAVFSMHVATVRDLHWMTRVASCQSQTL